MIDPKLTILGLLSDNWSLGYRPRFSVDWVDSNITLPHVTIRHLVTSPRFYAFSENLPAEDRRISGVYVVDVWSRGDPDQRWEMLGEVDRILHSKCTSPGGGLESLTVSAWRDLDEGGLRPPLFRSQTRVEVLYYG